MVKVLGARTPFGYLIPIPSGLNGARIGYAGLPYVHFLICPIILDAPRYIWCQHSSSCSTKFCTKSIFWYPLSLPLSHKKGYSGSLWLFRLDVHILQMFKYVDIKGMSTNSIMPFHNHDPISVHWFSHDQQNWARGTNALISVTPLRVWLFCFLKVSRSPERIGKNLEASLESVCPLRRWFDPVLWLVGACIFWK